MSHADQSLQEDTLQSMGQGWVSSNGSHAAPPFWGGIRTDLERVFIPVAGSHADHPVQSLVAQSRAQGTYRVRLPQLTLGSLGHCKTVLTCVLVPVAGLHVLSKSIQSPVTQTFGSTDDSLSIKALGVVT